jgi:peptide-methionine (S)-S-oxide reductase
MRVSKTHWIVIASGLLAAAIGFLSSAGAQNRPELLTATSRAEAVFAGGCFWCVEADFDKVEGVISTESGYTGGSSANPNYKAVTYGSEGHLEAVRVVYDPGVVSYEELVAHFFRRIDPTDAEGQFCDKGASYTTAVFVANTDQRRAAEAEIAEINASGILPAPVVTKVRTLGSFWPAEDYHQDYHRKEPVKYKLYRKGCGRDKALEKLWGAGPTG